MILTSLSTAWQARTPRERILLATLITLVVLFAGWYGVVSPLQRAAAAAESHHILAAQMLRDVEAAASALAASRGIVPVTDELSEAIEASAIASGIDLDSNRTEADDETTVRANDVAPANLFNWIFVLKEAHGIVVTHLTATRNEDGLLAVEVHLSRGRS